MKTLTTILFLCTCFSGNCLVNSVAAQETATQEKKTTQQETTQEETKTTEAADATKEKDAPAPIEVKVADGNIVFSATGTWKSVPPRSRILEAELKVPRVGTDAADGRLTIMGAGGTIELNIERWQGQFKQADGSDTKDHTKVEKQMVAGQQVSLVDITGTYIDSPGGPFAGGKKVDRPNYRMLSAIIQTAADGNYFVKLYGPKATIDKNAEHFKAMVKSIKIVE